MLRGPVGRSGEEAEEEGAERRGLGVRGWRPLDTLERGMLGMEMVER